MSSSRLAAVVLVLLILFGGLFVWRLGGDNEDADPITGPEGSTSPIAGDGDAGRVGYVVSRAGTILSAEPGASGQPIAAGIILPVISETDGQYEVFDICNRRGWVGSDQVGAGLIPVERGPGLDRSVFVIDAGHGFPDLGAVGPSGLTETEVNVDVADRIVELLASSHDIDWATGAITSGAEVPAAGAAISTRARQGPNGGDYELGLTFRAALANAVEATALVSIHHNTEPTRDLDHPGTAAFVSVKDPESPRLGGLIVAELRSAFSSFEADWVGGRGNGLSIRVGADGKDYYSLLEVSEVPAAIVEGAYISNPSEEALIMTEAFRQAYADGVYRALVRFVTTDDHPLPAPEPELFDVEAPSRSMDDCLIPAP